MKHLQTQRPYRMLPEPPPEIIRAAERIMLDHGSYWSPLETRLSPNYQLSLFMNCQRQARIYAYVNGELVTDIWYRLETLWGLRPRLFQIRPGHQGDL